MVNWWVLLDSHLRGSLFTIIIKPVGRFRTSSAAAATAAAATTGSRQRNDSQLTGTHAPPSVGQFLAFMKNIVRVYKIN